MRRRTLAVTAVVVVALVAIGYRHEAQRPSTTPTPTAVPAEIRPPAFPWSIGRADHDTAEPGPTKARGHVDGKPSGGDTLARVRAAIQTETAASTSLLVEALDSEDSIAKLEAIDELVRRKHVAVMDRLLAFDPADDPFVGPTALLGLGELARDADPRSRDAAVVRLSKLLDAEKARQGMDSAGNVLVIFESLGTIGTASSARVLERELVDPMHAVAARVAIVDAIEACGQRTSLAVLGPYRATLEVGAEEAHDRELQQDLASAVDRALTTLGRRG